jgi:hypothetical protein
MTKKPNKKRKKRGKKLTTQKKEALKLDTGM